MTKFKCLLAGFALAFGFAGFDAAAVAQNAPVGFDPTTSLQGFPGLDVSLGTPPVVTGCNTSAPVVVGGASAGRITTVGTTACTPTLTWTIPKLGAGGVAGTAGAGYDKSVFAPTLTGAYCAIVDITTTTKLFTESATTYTAPTATANGTVTCTFTASAAITAADVLLYTAAAF